MGEREYWQNVYRREAEMVGLKWESRELAEMASGPAVIARAHVRLKPEGAPKRYADEQDRYFWERAPHLMRMAP